jgi:insecticidal toxin complex protein TccC
MRSTSASPANIAFGTPDLVVMDNRGQAARALSYNRQSVGAALDERIERTTYDALGHVASHIDARFFAATGSPSANFAYQTSLSGRVLRTESVDAGTQWALADVDARPLWTRDGRVTVSTWTYDELGRPTTLAEAMGKDASATRAVWIYGEHEANAQANNLRGQCVRHYDTAGKLAWSGFRLTGQPLDETRWLLNDAEADPDWSGGDNETAWNGALDGTEYETAWAHDATGQWHEQTDAMQNVQRCDVDVAGRPSSSGLQVKNGAMQPVLSTIEYSAAGQVLSETAGNGAVSSYTYEPQTQRLIRLTVTRPVKANCATVVQDLSYTYDPVGNVVRVSDAAQATSYWRNQKIAPARIYGYDALYQLINATGREMANRGAQGHTLPPLTIPLPSDDSVYTNYSRTYTYDRGGNLTEIQHRGAASYTQAIVVSNRSNHAMMQNANSSLTPAGIDSGGWFDAGGNQQRLLPDQTQPLVWNGRSELKRVMLIKRSGSDDDREAYQYGGDGMRVRKRMTTQAKGVTRTVEAIYLPGLTLRVTSSGDGKTMTVSDSLQEICIEAGTIYARCLHWESGLPSNMINDLTRYGIGDRNGAIALELDDQADIVSREEYYPYGGTAVWAARSQVEADTKFVRYSGKERDVTGLYDYGLRYYQPWIGRWLNTDPGGIIDGLNLYCMVHNNPISYIDKDGLASGSDYRYVSVEPSEDATHAYESFFKKALQARSMGSEPLRPIFDDPAKYAQAFNEVAKSKITWMQRLVSFFYKTDTFKTLVDLEESSRIDVALNNAGNRLQRRKGLMSNMKRLGDNEIFYFLDADRPTIVAHGVGDGRSETILGVLGRRSPLKVLKPSELNNLIGMDSKYNTYRLMICSAGKGGRDSFAQELADLSGKKIEAFDHPIGPNEGAHTQTPYMLDVYNREMNAASEAGGDTSTVLSRAEAAFEDHFSGKSLTVAHWNQQYLKYFYPR